MILAITWLHTVAVPMLMMPLASGYAKLSSASTSGSQVLAEYTSNDNLDAEYIYALGRIIAILKPGRGYYWVYIDHLKSTRLVDGTDEFQTDTRRDYYPCREQ